MILKILTVPNPILKKKSKNVSKVDKSLERLAHDMAETIENYQSDIETGVAMAAVQIGKPVRLVVLREDDGSYVGLINPEVIKLYGEKKEDLEGCLSVPSIYGVVLRHENADIKGTSMDGKKFKLKTSGILSRILQHEIDHLNGVLFTDRVKNIEKIYKLDKEGKLLSQKGEILNEAKFREY